MIKLTSESAADKRNPALKAIRARIAKTSTEPGVYRWLDKEGNVLYVGKAKNLRNRLKSYVAADGMKSQGPWKMALVEQIHDFDAIVTNTELEALLLETNLIKERKPKYNVLMKDDKHHVYFKITMQDAFPRTEIVRRMEHDKAKYFGPFLTAWELRNTLDMLHRVLGYRSCAKSLDILNRDPKNTAALKPCLESQIGQCNGLCTGTLSQEEYRARMDAVVSFFRGQYDPVLVRAKELMQQAATEKKFERAAEFRNVIQYIESLKEKQIVSDTSKEDMDAIGVALLSGKAQVVLLRKRGGKLLSEYQLSLQGWAEDIGSILSQFIPQYYAETQDIPEIILLPCDIADAAVLAEWLCAKREARVTFRVPERGKKSSLLDLAMKNAEQKVKQSEAKWESEARNIESALEELQTQLKLPTKPKRIEGYDISHLGGEYTSASMVVMHDGKPKRDHYRSFTIRSLGDGKIDDYKSLQEALRRRLKYLVTSFEQEEAEWEEKKVCTGRAKKSDIEQIQGILPTLRPLETFDYTEFFVLRKEETVIGFARVHAAQKTSFALSHVWVHADHRVELLHFLLRRITKSIKKGKLYSCVDHADENLYASLGFRHLLALPAFLKIDEPDKEIAVMFDAFQNKIDPSFMTRPDLLLIDGGKGQLNAVVDVLKEYALDIPVAGLAKRYEEVFLPGESHSIALAPNTPASFLLQRLRDEAHRFANSLREGKGMRAMTQSALDGIAGIGPKTRTELLKTFGSVEGIKAATDEALKSVLSEAQIQALRKAL